MGFGHRAPGAQLRNGSITVIQVNGVLKNDQCIILSLTLQPPFEENGIASPIDLPHLQSQQQQMHMQQQQQQQQNGANLNTSMDSAMMQQQQAVAAQAAAAAAAAAAAQQQQQLAAAAMFAANKNRFLSGDQTNREAMLRRQMFNMGKFLVIRDI